MKKFFSLFILTLTMYLLSASFVSADADLAKILKPAASVPEGYYILMPQCAPSRALSIKNALLQTEREKLRQDIVGRYDKSINKLEETILKNGLSGSGIAITQIVALENQ
jgi:hypothetical protein